MGSKSADFNIKNQIDSIRRQPQITHTRTPQQQSPYLERFAGDLREENDVSKLSDLERDSGDATAQALADAGVDGDGPRQTAPAPCSNQQGSQGQKGQLVAGARFNNSLLQTVRLLTIPRRR